MKTHVIFYTNCKTIIFKTCTLQVYFLIHKRDLSHSGSRFIKNIDFNARA